MSKKIWISDPSHEVEVFSTGSLCNFPGKSSGLTFYFCLLYIRFGEWWGDQESTRDRWWIRGYLSLETRQRFRGRSRPASSDRWRSWEERPKSSGQRKQASKEVLAYYGSAPFRSIRFVLWGQLHFSNILYFGLQKMEKRLLRNRVSAQQARERKKAYLTDLETRVKELEKKNSELEERLSTLQNENQMLRHVCTSSLYHAIIPSYFLVYHCSIIF